MKTFYATPQEHASPGEWVGLRVAEDGGSVCSLLNGQQLQASAVESSHHRQCVGKGGEDMSQGWSNRLRQ